MHQFSYFLLPYKQKFYSYILIDYRIVKLSAFLYCQKCGRTRTLPTTDENMTLIKTLTVFANRQKMTM